MNHLQSIAFVSAIAAVTCLAPADSSVTFKPDAKGKQLFEQLTFAGRSILSDNPQSPGCYIRLTAAGDGSLDSLFNHQADITLVQQVESVSEVGGVVKLVGHYTHDQIKLPFVRSFKQADTLTIDVTEEIDFTSLPATLVVADQQWVLPLKVNADEHQRMMAFAGEHRTEKFRMDRNDVNYREMLISDNRGYQPFWDLGGVIQLPTGYSIWKANHANTLAYPLDEGTTAPGWADYSEDEWGVSVGITDPRAAAPWSITINARAGIIAIAGQSPSQPARSGKDLAKRTLTFRLAFHETSWPTFDPCELDAATYTKFLDYLIERCLNNVVGSYLTTSDPHKIRVRERMQPSVVLRTVYRGDDWRMGSLMKDIGQGFTRGQSMPEREKRAKLLLDYVKQHGVPAIKK